MVVNIHIATRVRSDPDGLLEHGGALEAALIRAAGRALGRAERDILAPRGRNIEIVLNLPPTVAWRGERAADIALADRAAIEKILIGALMRAIDKAALKERAGPAPAAPALTREISEPFDPARCDPENGAYVIPSYDEASAGGKRTLVPMRSARQPAGRAASWTSHEIEFFAEFGRFLALVAEARNEAVSDVEVLRTRHYDQLEQSVAAVLWIVDVHTPISWRALAADLLSLQRTRFGRQAPYAYFWDPVRRNELIALDRRHLSGRFPDLKSLGTEPPKGVDFKVAEGTRLALVACVVPELELEDVVSIEEAFQVQVPLSSLLDSGFIRGDDFARLFCLSAEQLAFLRQEDRPVAVRALPLTARRRVNVASLKILVVESARRIHSDADLFGRLLLLSHSTLNELPSEIAYDLRKCTDETTLRARDDVDVKADHWRPGWRGVFVHPIFQDVMAQAARSKAKEQMRTSEASQLIAILDDSDRLAKFIDGLPEDWKLFEALLEGLEQRDKLARFFDALREAKGSAWEWDRPRQFKVTRLAHDTRYRNHPALVALVRSLQFHAFSSSIIESPHHTYDLASQSILLLGRSDRRVQARGNSEDNKKGVVAEVSDYYAEAATVYRPNDKLMQRLSEPVYQEIGKILSGMACSESGTMTQEQIIAKATDTALGSLTQKPTKDDFVPVKARMSLRVLALEEPIVDGVPRLKVKFEPVIQIEGGTWDATGSAESLIPGDFETRLTYYHVQHMMEALTAGLTIVLLASAVLGGAIFIVARGIAGLGELIVMIVLSEFMYVLMTPKSERSVAGYLGAALLAELDLVGFKALSFASKLGLRLTVGRLLTGKILGNTITKWIAFALRGTVTASEVGALSVFDHFAKELFQVTRCRGFSSADEYWDHFKTGFKIGLLFEFVAVPWLAPAFRVALGKASTYLEATQVLLKTEKGLGEIVSTLLRGQNGLEEALGRTLKPEISEPLARSYKGYVDKFFETLGREYKTRAYGSVFELLGVDLDRAAREGLSRLLSARSQAEIDRFLQTLEQAKLPPADFLRTVGELDADALAAMLKGTNLTQLARSPNVVALFRTNGSATLSILRGPFRFSIENCERYLGALERLPVASRESVLRALLEHDPLPPDLLLRAARGLGSLDAATVGWMRNLYEARVRMVEDAIYEGTTKQIEEAFAAADKIGLRVERTFNNTTGVWRTKAGERTLEIRDRDWSPKVREPVTSRPAQSIEEMIDEELFGYEEPTVEPFVWPEALEEPPLPPITRDEFMAQVRGVNLEPLNKDPTLKERMEGLWKNYDKRKLGQAQRLFRKKDDYIKWRYGTETKILADDLLARLRAMRGALAHPAAEAGRAAQLAFGELIVKTNENKLLFPIDFVDPITNESISVNVAPDFMPTSAVDETGKFVSARRVKDSVVIADSKYKWAEGAKVRFDDRNQIKGMLALAKKNHKPFVFLVKEGGDVAPEIRKWCEKLGLVEEVDWFVRPDVTGRVR